MPLDAYLAQLTVIQTARRHRPARPRSRCRPSCSPARRTSSSPSGCRAACTRRSPGSALGDRPGRSRLHVGDPRSVQRRLRRLRPHPTRANPPSRADTHDETAQGPSAVVAGSRPHGRRSCSPSRAVGGLRRLAAPAPPRPRKIVDGRRPPRRPDRRARRARSGHLLDLHRRPGLRGHLQQARSTWTPTGNFVPDLATSWEQDDPTTWTFNLVDQRHLPQRRALHLGRRDVHLRAHPRPEDRQRLCRPLRPDRLGRGDRPRRRSSSTSSRRSGRSSPTSPPTARS